MDMNRVGKFEVRPLIDAFDRALIELYGKNMLDAQISRYEALAAIEEIGDSRQAAEVLGARKGLVRLASRQ
ncbi:MAG: hypothetical protein N2441_10315 [Rhodocyclaceae bacterium]|nr:hypothetical protein [Rhodocyclaceae bacterium]